MQLAANKRIKAIRGWGFFCLLCFFSPLFWHQSLACSGKLHPDEKLHCKDAVKGQMKHTEEHVTSSLLSLNLCTFLPCLHLVFPRHNIFVFSPLHLWLLGISSPTYCAEGVITGIRHRDQLLDVRTTEENMRKSSSGYEMYHNWFLFYFL